MEEAQLGLAVTALFAMISCAFVGAASLAGGAVALVQRARRKGGLPNIVLAAVVLAWSTVWGALSLVSWPAARTDPNVVVPVLLSVALSGGWLLLAQTARRARLAAEMDTRRSG